MNTRFAVAVHILTFLQMQPGQPASSELIASSVNTNPAVIRRLLSQLAKAGLSMSQMGTGGGALLARPGETITLLDIYRAVDEEGTVFGMHSDPNPAYTVGRLITPILQARMQSAERALLDDLAKTTIARLAAEVMAEDKRQSKKAPPARSKP